MLHTATPAKLHVTIFFLGKRVRDDLLIDQLNDWDYLWNIGFCL